MIILKMDERFSYPGITMKRDIWSRFRTIIKDEWLVRVCRSRCRLSELCIRSGLREKKKINWCISEERTRTKEGGVKGGQVREHSMFPKCDMARYMKSVRNKVPTTKTFLFCATTKKATKADTWFKFNVFMRMEKNKASTIENFKVRVVRRSTIKSFEWRDVLKNRGRKSVDGCFTPKFFRRRGREKERTYWVKDVTMFALNTPIMLRSVGTGAQNKSALLREKRKEGEVFILQGIISGEDFNRTRELSVNHGSKLNISVR